MSYLKDRFDYDFPQGHKTMSGIFTLAFRVEKKLSQSAFSDGSLSLTWDQMRANQFRVDNVGLRLSLDRRNTHPADSWRYSGFSVHAAIGVSQFSIPSDESRHTFAEIGANVLMGLRRVVIEPGVFLRWRSEEFINGDDRSPMTIGYRITVYIRPLAQNRRVNRELSE